jgi:hypothetical protein
MDAVVYPVKEIGDFIMNEMIPLRIPTSNEEMTKKFEIKWTPTLITMDVNEKEHQRTLGFMGVDELIPSLLLGMAKIPFDEGEPARAIELLQKVIDDYPKSNSVPEAIFLRGVAGYKNTHQAAPLKEAYNILNQNYPDTTWAKRAYPYSLL